MTSLTRKQRRFVLVTLVVMTSSTLLLLLAYAPGGDDPRDVLARDRIPRRRPNNNVVDGGGDLGASVLDRRESDAAGPGAGGAGVDVGALTRNSPEEAGRMRRKVEEYSVNQYTSEKISLHRTIDDRRHHLCKERDFDYLNLPTATVVIAFFNEGRTTLLRTIYSVLHTSPKSLLKEIILIDDFSDKPHLKEPLERDLASIPRVRLIRTAQREGLVRARLLGASKAKGEVVVFLDCHCECMDGWLEPLLERIHEDPTVITIPVIDTIDWNTFQYYYGGHEPQIGGFDWRLTFQWHVIPQHERRRRRDEIAPIRSPTMAGGLFAIDRSFFIRIGTYDHGMEIWGGENLELSFRTWMCGGSLETIPCSHVGHVFPKESPYPRPKFLKNTVRAAEVWLDDYKRHFYIRNPTALKEEYGDISDRVQLRKQLKCKSFQWYLTNIYPDLRVPEDIPGRYGALRNEGERQYCLDYALPSDDPLAGTLSIYPCHGQGGNQFFEYSSRGELRFNSEREMCVATSSTTSVVMSNCLPDEQALPDSHKWKYTDDFRLENSSQGGGESRCLEAEIASGGKMSLHLRACDRAEKRQKWHWYTT